MPYNEDVCAKSGRIVPYMQHRDCFEYPGTKEEPIEENIMNETKTKICKECGRELPLDHFSTQYKSKDGHLAICKDCMKARKSEAMKTALAEKKGHEDKNVTMSHCHTAAPAVAPTATLLGWLDQELADELRRRGYEVTCTKTISL